ncbi:MAG: response regulator transcription factor [Candidatus Omnitrophica bacterium]|nr:response regulator transcription factor [Candidatus Omnitrophota bacterium]
MDDKKILVIDDDAALRLAIRDYLGHNGFKNVTTVTNGAEAMAWARDNTPDLIICDIAMPGMDGYTFIQEFRNDNRLKGVPVIVLTGRGEMVDIFKMAGIDNYFIKPVDPKALLARVRRLLGSTDR